MLVALPIDRTCRSRPRLRPKMEQQAYLSLEVGRPWRMASGRGSAVCPADEGRQTKDSGSIVSARGAGALRVSLANNVRQVIVSTKLN